MTLVENDTRGWTPDTPGLGKENHDDDEDKNNNDDNDNNNKNNNNNNNITTNTFHLRNLEAGSALNERLADKRSDGVHASLVIFAPGASGLAFVDVDTGAAVSGAIPQSALDFIAGAGRVVQQRSLRTLARDAAERPLRVGAGESRPAIVRAVAALVVIHAPLRVTVQRVPGAAGILAYAAETAARVLATLPFQTSGGHELTLVDVLALLRRRVTLEAPRTRLPEIAASVAPKGAGTPAAAGTGVDSAARGAAAADAAASRVPQDALIAAPRVDAA